MVKLIVVALISACCQTLSIEGAPQGATTVVDQWIANYAEVFAETRQIPSLSHDELIERMELMHSTMGQVSDSSNIGEHMIYTVNRWYSAITDKNAAHCNLEHFNHLSHDLDSLLSIQDPPTNNRERLFGLFYLNFGSFCRQVLAGSLVSSLGDQTTSDLRNIKLAHESFVEGKISRRDLAKRLLEPLRLRRSSTVEEIINSWKHGPCNRLQLVIGIPERRAIYNLVRQDVLRQRAEWNEVQETIDLCFGMERVCNRLDSMISDLANEHTSGIMSRVGRSFGT